MTVKRFHNEFFLVFDGYSWNRHAIPGFLVPQTRGEHTFLFFCYCSPLITTMSALISSLILMSRHGGAVRILSYELLGFKNLLSFASHKSLRKQMTGSLSLLFCILIIGIVTAFTEISIRLLLLHKKCTNRIEINPAGQFCRSFQSSQQ